MSDGLKSTIEILGTIGTLIIAFAALVVARRQTTAAEQQASIAEDLKELAAIQAVASKSQADAAQAQLAQALSVDAYMRALQTPQLVPADAEYVAGADGGTLRFTLKNVGGGRARDVWIDEIEVIKPWLEWIGDPQDNVVAVKASQRVDVVLEEAPVEIRVDLPADFNAVEKVIRMTGHFTDLHGERQEIEYQPV